MTRNELLNLLRSAQLPYPDVQIVVVGSQSVLGTHSDQELPERATLSMEADVMYRRQGAYDEKLTDQVDATFGEGSAFHEENGVYLQGVDETTCVLPGEWNGRLVTLAELPSRAGGSMPVLCLDPHDLAVAKLAAGRAKGHRVRVRAAGVGSPRSRRHRRALSNCRSVSQRRRDRGALRVLGFRGAQQRRSAVGGAVGVGRQRQVLLADLALAGLLEQVLPGTDISSVMREERHAADPPPRCAGLVLSKRGREGVRSDRQRRPRGVEVDGDDVGIGDQ